MQPIRLILTIIGIVLLVILVFWIGSSLTGLDETDLINLADGSGVFVTSARLPGAITAEVEKGRRIIAEQNQQYRTLSWVSELGMWISFAATAVITLMTGAFNFPTPDETKGKGKIGRFHFLGFMAALASICTLLAAQTSSIAEQRLNAAEEVEDVISEVVTEIREDPGKEQALLVKLDAVLGKYE